MCRAAYRTSREVVQIEECMMESLEIRDRRFRLQQEIESLQKQIAGIQETCPHEHREDDGHYRMKIVEAE